VVHGVREESELFYREEFEAGPYFPCLSREPDSEWSGRVSDLAEGHAFDPASHFYLCGAFEMIFDVHRILTGRDFPDDAIFAEEYYYRFQG